MVLLNASTGVFEAINFTCKLHVKARDKITGVNFITSTSSDVSPGSVNGPTSASSARCQVERLEDLRKYGGPVRIPSHVCC